MTIAKLEEEIAALGDLPREVLIKRWKYRYRKSPPSGISQQLLIRAMAYELQVKRHGRLNLATARQLRAIAAGTANPKLMDRNSSPAAQPGTRLIREWHGVTHTVIVMETGVIWNGTRYPSLTAVARAITGTEWSGPRFFGLVSKKSK